MEMPSMSRQQRHKQLCFEIDRLVAQYPLLPPGRAQAACRTEIDLLMAQVDDLNKEQDDTSKTSEVAKKQTGFTWTIRPPVVTVGMLLIYVSFVFSSPTVAVVGLCACAVGLGMFSRADAPEKTEEAKTDGPDHAEGFRWRP